MWASQASMAAASARARVDRARRPSPPCPSRSSASPRSSQAVYTPTRDTRLGGLRLGLRARAPLGLPRPRRHPSAASPGTCASRAPTLGPGRSGPARSSSVSDSGGPPRRPRAPTCSEAQGPAPRNRDQQRPRRRRPIPGQADHLHGLHHAAARGPRRRRCEQRRALATGGGARSPSSAPSGRRVAPNGWRIAGCHRGR